MARESWMRWVFFIGVIIFAFLILYISGAWDRINAILGDYWAFLVMIAVLLTWLIASYRFTIQKKNLDPVKALELYVKKQSSGKLSTLDIFSTNWDLVDKHRMWGKWVLQGDMMFKNPDDINGIEEMSQNTLIILDPVNDKPDDENSSLFFYHIGPSLTFKEIEKICRMGAPTEGIEAIAQKLGEAKELTAKIKEASEEEEAST